MSFLRKAREITGDVAAASKRQAQRGKLEIEMRRLEGKVSSEKDAIGHALFPLLESGTLQTDVPDVASHMAAIKQLLGEIGERKAEIDALGQSDGGRDSDAADASMKDTDQNALPGAGAVQAAADSRAEENQSPADQGGES